MSVDGLQYRSRQGPCPEASTGDVVVTVEDLETDPRWPSFSQPCARGFGVRSMLAATLALPAKERGALTFYASHPAAFGDSDVAVAALLAPFVALVVRHQTHGQEMANLETALTTSRQIGTALGILMAQQAVTSEEAFAMLRTSSQTLNRKLRNVADDVVYTGDLPPGPPPRSKSAGAVEP